MKQMSELGIPADSWRFSWVFPEDLPKGSRSTRDIYPTPTSLRRTSGSVELDPTTQTAPTRPGRPTETKAEAESG